MRVSDRLDDPVILGKDSLPCQSEIHHSSFQKMPVHPSCILSPYDQNDGNKNYINQ